MNSRARCYALLLFCVVVAFLVLAGPAAMHRPETPVYRYEVIASYPHDRFAFTEGLSWSGGFLIEGTGLYGNSTIRRVNLTTGSIVQSRSLPREYFGEGVTVFGDRIAQLTEESHTGFIYDRDTLTETGNFSYPTEGWGIAWDGNHLIMSDGTSVLHVLDPATLAEVRRIKVQDRGAPVSSLNELEYVNGEIYANVWPTDRIARISPASGDVTGWIDLTGLLSPGERSRIGLSAIEYLRGRTSMPLEQEACLNGIAYDPEGDRLFVTGKLWPSLFEIRVVR